MASLLTLSVVSHGHGPLLHGLLRDVERCSGDVEVLLTINVPEPLPFDPAAFPFPLRITVNSAPRGFGANHNAAFRRSGGDFFCVLNPDIRFSEDPFPALCGALAAERRIGVVAPLVLSPAGGIEDSARRFPTLASLARKAFSRGPALDYDIGEEPFTPDWVGGMFMLFRRSVFERVGGFDERYFLYYEDVDLCRRLADLGYRARVVPAVRVVHAARRRSRRNLRHMMWHAASMWRYLVSARRRGGDAPPAGP